MISKRRERETLPLVCEVTLTVLTFGQNDNFSHVFLPLFYYDICVFTPVLDQQVDILYTDFLENFDSVLADNPHKHNLISHNKLISHILHQLQQTRSCNMPS